MGANWKGGLEGTGGEGEEGEVHEHATRRLWLVLANASLPKYQLQFVL